MTRKEEIQIGQLLRITDFTGRTKLLYVESISGDVAFCRRVTKNFSFDRRNTYKTVQALYGNDIIEVIDPIPSAFLESLRTLHFWVEEVLEDFGKIVDPEFKTMLRAVKFENESYGIIQNRMYNDMSEINPEYNVMNVFEDLSYEELCEKWKIKKNNSGTEWRK